MKQIALLGLLLLVAGVVFAQDDCGDGLPCGPVPWDIIDMPPLTSPTALPDISLNPGLTATSSFATPTPAPTLDGPEVTELANQMATLQAVMSNTPYVILNAEGTEIVTADLEAISGDTELFFSYARGLSELTLGPFAPLVAFMFTALLIVIAIKIVTLTLPLWMLLLGVIRKAIGFVLEFLPL